MLSLFDTLVLFLSYLLLNVPFLEGSCAGLLRLRGSLHCSSEWLHLFPFRELKEHGVKLPLCGCVAGFRFLPESFIGRRLDARIVAVFNSFFKRSKVAHSAPTKIMLNSLARGCVSRACRTSSIKHSSSSPTVTFCIISLLRNSSHLWKKSFRDSPLE